MSLLGELAVNIVGNTQDIKEGFKEAGEQTLALQTQMQQMGQKIRNIGKNMTRWVTGPLATVGVAVFENARRTGNYADEILDLSSATGLSTERLQEYRAIADRAGISTDAIAKAQQSLTRQMTRSEGGSASMNSALEQLGLTYEDLEQKTPDEQLDILMKKLQGVEEEGERARLGTAILRGNYEELAPVLDMSAEQMEKVTEQARENGRIMSQEALEQANEFRMGLDELKSEFTGLLRTIAVDFMPVLTDSLLPTIKSEGIPVIRSFSSFIGGLFEAFASLPGPTQKIIIGITGILAALGPVLAILGPIISGFSALAPVFAALTGPVGAVIAIIGALGVAAYQLYQNWEEVKIRMQIVLENLSYNIAQSMSKAKESVHRGIKGMLDNISKLSVIPGLGDKIGDVENALDEMIKDEQINRIENYSEHSIRLAELKGELAEVTEEAKEKEEEYSKAQDEIRNKIDEANKSTAEQINAEKLNFNSKEELISQLKEQGLTQEEITELIQEANISLDKNTEKTDENKEAVKNANDIYDDYKEEIAEIENLNKVWGDSYDETNEKIKATERAINQLIRNGVDPESEKVQKLIDLLEELEEEQNKVSQSTKDMTNTMQNSMERSFENILTETDSFSDIFTNTQEAMKDIVGGIYQEMASQIASSLAETIIAQDKWLVEQAANMATAVSKAVSAAYMNLLNFFAFLGPGAPAAAAATVGAGMASMAALANEAGEMIELEEGGKVEDETVAMIGEGSDEEVVMPLNDQVFAELASGIISQMQKLSRSGSRQPATAAAGNMNNTNGEGQGATQRVMNVQNNKREQGDIIIQAGTLVADRLGIKKLVRDEIIPVLQKESNRKSGDR